MTDYDLDLQRVAQQYAVKQSPRVTEIMTEIYEALLLEFHNHPSNEGDMITIFHNDLGELTKTELDFHMRKYFGQKFKTMTWTKDLTFLSVVRKPVSLYDQAFDLWERLPANGVIQWVGFLLFFIVMMVVSSAFNTKPLLKNQGQSNSLHFLPTRLMQ